MGSNRRQSDITIENRSSKTLRKGFAFFATTCSVATAGYVIAGWGWIDAIYMVTITIFGVGYGEVQPIEDQWLKFFTIGVIFAGCSSLIYVIGGIVQMLTEGEIEEMLGLRSRSREIDQLSDHTIICGYGRVGQMLAEELANQESPLVVIDRDAERIEQAIHDGFLAMQGDAVEDDVLCQAGLLRAKTLATVLPDDAKNVFITLTARDLSDSVRIISRAEHPSTERKLLRGGATSVVMPSAIGALRIAQLATSTDDVQSQLPEDRFRMIRRSADARNLDAGSEAIEKSVETEIQDLAVLAEESTGSGTDRYEPSAQENCAS